MDDRNGVINALILDTDTGCIRIGNGATGWFEIVFDNIEQGVLDTDTDVVVFSAERVESERRRIIGSVNGFVVTNGSSDADKVWHKKFDISVNDDGKYCAAIGLTNADTRAIGIGKHRWNAVIITDPEYDDNGDIVVDDTDSVVPLYLDDDRPELIVEGVGYIVR